MVMFSHIYTWRSREKGVHIILHGTFLQTYMYRYRKSGNLRETYFRVLNLRGVQFARLTIPSPYAIWG